MINKNEIFDIGMVYTSPFPKKKPMASDRRASDIANGLTLAGANITMMVPKRFKNASFEDTSLLFNIVYLGSIFENIFILNRLIFWYKVAMHSKNKRMQAVIFYTPTVDSIIAFKLLKFFKIPSVLEFCDLISTNLNKNFYGYLIFLGEKLLPKHANLILPISSVIENFVKFYAPNKLTYLLPVLVDSKTFKKNNIANVYEKINTNEVVISYAGGMWKNYGLDLLIEAFAIVASDNINVKLYIAGNLEKNNSFTDVDFLVSKYKLQDKVILTGWLGTSEVIELLNKSDVLVVPHLNDKFNNAGLPTKIAEYASLGKAILATNVGDVNKYFSHLKDIYIVEGSNLLALVNGLQVLIKDSHLRENLGYNAQITGFNNFDFQINGQKLLDQIKKLNSLG